MSIPAREPYDNPVRHLSVVREATRDAQDARVAVLEVAKRRRSAPAAVTRKVAMVVLEVEAGCRSAAHLERLCALELWERLEAQIRRQGGALPNAQSVLNVIAQEPVAGVANTVAVVQRDQRVQSILMRLEARKDRWLVTDLSFLPPQAFV